MLKRTLVVFALTLISGVIVGVLWPPNRPGTAYNPNRGLITLAQAQQFVIQQPDCQIFFTFTAAGQTSPTSPNPGLDNRAQGCDTWNVTYSNSGFASVSVALQGASNSAGVPGAYTTGLSVQQTILSGLNPGTSTTGGFLWVVGYSPWVRVSLTTAGGSGVVNGAAYGWRIPSAGGGSSGTVSANVNVQQWGGVTTSLGQKVAASSVPVVLASDAALPLDITQLGGANIYPCMSQATFNLSAAGNTQIVAASGATIVRICHLSFSTIAPEDVKVTRGTGVNCATGATDVTGLYKSVQAGAFDYGPYSPLKGAASGAICINQSVAQALGGVVLYDQR